MSTTSKSCEGGMLYYTTLVAVLMRMAASEIADMDILDAVPGLHGHMRGQDVYANTHEGTLLGKRRPVFPDAGGIADAVDFFLGVPYVQPPTGKLRFKPPEPVRQWRGIRNATKLPPSCPQYSSKSQDEDCLYLNIYSPHRTASSDENFPVLVYIHGGSYRVGSGSDYPGHILAQQGIVVITINYRLGALGFLSSGTSELPGNYGLMDQIAALVWLQLNLHAFYGDPGRVTIAGNSAGGASVGLLAISPAAKGLFDRVIIQSGSPFSFWAMHNDTVELGSHMRHLGVVHGCQHTSVASVVTCLQAVPWKAFAYTDYSELPRISPSRTDVRPRIDGTIIPASLHDMYAQERVNARAVMTGLVEEEWSRHILYFLSEELLPAKPHLDDQMNDGMDREMFKEAVQHVVSNRFWWHEALAPIIVHEYTNWNSVDDPEENRHKYIQLISDMAMLAPTVKLAEICTSRDVPVYLYHFAHQSPAEDDSFQPWQRNFHQIELNYIFGSPFTGFEVNQGRSVNFTDEDRQVSLFAMRLWANFAGRGDPSFDENTWYPYSSDTGAYFSIAGHGGVMDTFLRSEKVSFWNDLIPALRMRMEGVTNNPQLVTKTTSFWVLLVICVMLLLLLLGSLVFISVKQKSMLRSV